MNKHARVREYFIELISNWSIHTIDDVKILSSILSRLTQTTHQLTSKSSVNLHDKHFSID